jgi:hypothetical protein
MDISNYEYKRGSQPRTNIVRDEKGDLFADSNSILGRWRNYFYQLLNYLGLIKLDIQNTHSRRNCLRSEGVDNYTHL